MDLKDIAINTRLMEEMGLESGFRKRVYDRESGDIRMIRGKEMVAPGCIPGRNSVEFDPINNTRMMSYLFGNYVTQLSTDGIIDGDIMSYYTVPVRAMPGKVKVIMKINPGNGDPIQEISSKPFRNETVCYADLIMKLNGKDDIDVGVYDVDKKAERNRRK